MCHFSHFAGYVILKIQSHAACAKPIRVLPQMLFAGQHSCSKTRKPGASKAQLRHVFRTLSVTPFLQSRTLHNPPQQALNIVSLIRTIDRVLRHGPSSSHVSLSPTSREDQGDSSHPTRSSPPRTFLPTSRPSRRQASDEM